jgi:hypothetical protein
MASSIDEPFSTPSMGVRYSPELALQWILSNVPCFSGPVPVDWTRAVFREASRWNIKFSMLQAALSMADKHGFVFTSEPVHATKHTEIGRQWQARKAEFIAVASFDNYLNAHQLFQIWQNFWSEQRARAGIDEDRIRRQIHDMNPAVYADNMNRFELGRRDALGPTYQEAADRLDATNAMLFAANELLNWLEAREATGEHYTLQQANEKAIEITKAWNKFETWFGPVIFGVLGMASMGGMGGGRGGRSASELGRTPTSRSYLPPEPVPDPSIPPHLKRIMQGDHPAVRLGQYGRPGNLIARVDSAGEGVTYRVTSIVLRGEGATAEIQLARSAHRAMIRRAAEMARKVGAKTFKLVGEQAGPNFRTHADALAEQIGIPKSGKVTSKIGGAYGDYEVTLRVDLTLQPSAPSSTPSRAPSTPPPSPSGPARAIRAAAVGSLARPAPPSFPPAPPARKALSTNK